MSYRHVEDTEHKSFTWFRDSKGLHPVLPLRHSVWRCGHCRALLVTLRGKKPPDKCAKCKL